MGLIIYAGAFLAGACVWTLVEYGLHRGLGHRAGARNEFTVEHLAHHADLTYFPPAWKKGLAACVVLGVAAPSLMWLFGEPGLAGAIGFVLMYITYEYVHRRLHTHPPLTRYGRWARRHHLYHHFKRPHLNHGVTTPVWDLVFRTLEVPPRIRVPRRSALAWMVDERGALREEFEADFELVGRAKQSEPAAVAPTRSPA